VLNRTAFERILKGLNFFLNVLCKAYIKYFVLCRKDKSLVPSCIFTFLTRKNIIFCIPANLQCDMKIPRMICIYPVPLYPAQSPDAPSACWQRSAKFCNVVFSAFVFLIFKTPSEMKRIVE